MFRLLAISVCLLVLLSGCRSYLPISEQLPSVEYKSHNSLVVTIVDSRTERRDYSPQYIGTTIMAFGIPVQRKTSFITGTYEDETKPLAKYLQERVVSSLTTKGWNVRSIDIDHIPDSNEVTRILTKENAQKLLLINLTDWYFSLNLSGAFGILSQSEFWFKNATDVYIFDPESPIPFKKQISGDQIIRFSSVSNENTQGKNFPNMIVFAFRNQLSNIVNEPSVRSQLLNQP